MENLSVKTLVRLLGINEHTLRAWERRHAAIEPQRSANGRRLYSSEDFERLQLLTALTKKGASIGNIAGLPTPSLKKMAEEIAALAPPTDRFHQPIPRETSEDPITIEEKHLRNILKCLEAFDLEKLNHSLLKARFELSPKDITIHLIVPLMRKVGDFVYCSKLRIGQEHLLSALLRDHLGQIYQSLSPYDFSSRAGAPAIALATREGDIHEFGILLSAILSAVHRQRTHYFGCNMPVDSLVHVCKELKIKILILGLAQIPPEREIITPVEYLRTLDHQLPPGIEIWTGGGGLMDQLPFPSQRKILTLASLEQLDLMLAGSQL